MTDTDFTFITLYLIALVLGCLCAMPRWADIQKNRSLAYGAVGIVSILAIRVLMGVEMLQVDASYSYSFRAFILSLGIATFFLLGISLSSKFFSRNRTDD